MESKKENKLEGPHQLSAFFFRHRVPHISSPDSACFWSFCPELGAPVLGVCCRARGPALPDKPGVPKLLWGSGLSTGASLNLGLLPRSGWVCEWGGGRESYATSCRSFVQLPGVWSHSGHCCLRA